MALPRSRVPPLKPGPALRPRGCPAHAPSRTQDCGLPAHAHRRLPTTLPIAGLNDAASLLAPPGSVRPLTGRHAGSLLNCWLDVSQVGRAPHSAHPLGNTNQLHGVPSSSKVSGLPWREHAFVRLGLEWLWVVCPGPAPANGLHILSVAGWNIRPASWDHGRIVARYDDGPRAHGQASDRHAS